MKIVSSLLVFLISVAYVLSAGVYKVKVSSSLNIRKKGNTSSGIVGTLKNGDVIYATSVNNGWAKFYKGFVSTKYLTKVSTPGNYVTTENLNFRTGPSTSYKRLTTLSRGTLISYYGRDPFNDKWAVTSRGYASAKYLTPKNGGGNNTPSNPSTPSTPSTPSNTSTRIVIDVSKYNSKEKRIENYDTAAKNIDGVIIRCGIRGYGSAGTLQKDQFLDTHYNGFKGKTKIGYYFFSQAINTKEAEAEANYVVNTLLKGKTVDFPIYLDSEYSNENKNGRADSLSKATRTNVTIAFINRIKALGYRAGVYASDSWFKDRLNFQQIVNSGASIWVAKYNTEKPTISQYDMWQYTSKGRIGGIKGDVDVSRAYKNVAGW